MLSLKTSSTRKPKVHKGCNIPYGTLVGANSALIRAYYYFNREEDLPELVIPPVLETTYSDEHIFNYVDKGKLFEFIKQYLSPREINVIYLKHLLEYTYEETGRVVGVTKERIRQIEHKAIRKVNNRLCISRDDSWGDKKFFTPYTDTGIRHTQSLQKHLKLRPNMQLITIDFETYYSKDLGFRTHTTEEYVRDPAFHVIGVGIKIDDDEPMWASGSHKDLKEWLKRFDWDNSVAIAHNAIFDGAILNWHFDIRPKFWIDTLCMARALHGVEVGGSLEALAQRYNVGKKGEEVKQFIGYKREDFSPEELSLYGDYCVNDVALTRKIYNMMQVGFPKKELHLINLTTRMFTEPVLRLNTVLLEEHLQDIQQSKEALLTESGVSREDLMSNPKFAEILKSYGIVPPMKISPTTGKETLALAKNDEEFKALAEHPDVRVQALVSARLGTKSTLEETRTQRFMGIASRGLLPVPIKYYAAHTGRFGGDDKINLQNLPSRGDNAGKLKDAILAPQGHSIIDADSASIEARVLAWLAEENTLVQAFANKEDVYKKMASSIYEKAEADITKEERFVGKTTILGAGYGMGAVKFQAQLKSFGVDISIEEARRIVDVYRKNNPAITALWRQAQTCLVAMTRDEPASLGRKDVLSVITKDKAIKLPSKLLMRYDDLSFVDGEQGVEFSYKTRKGRTRIYGGKVIENVCQAIARCIIAEQMLKISQRYKVVLTVHDAVACIVPDDKVVEAVAFVGDCMRWTPDWASGLPVDCESGVGKSYGDC